MAEYGASGLLPSWMFDERFGQDWPQMQTAPQGFNGGYMDYRWGPENDGGKAFNQFDVSQRYNGMTGIDPRAMGESVLTANDPNMPPPPYQAPQQPMGPLPPQPAPDWLNGPPTRVAGGSAMGYAPEQPKPQQPLANFPAQAPQPSGWDRFGQGINNNAMTLVGLGAGIAGGRGWGEGISQGLRGAMAGQVADRKQQTATQVQTAIGRALLAKGVNPTDVAAIMLNPDSPHAKAVIAQHYPEAKSGVVVNGVLVDPMTGRPRADLRDADVPTTREFEQGGIKQPAQWNYKTRQWETPSGLKAPENNNPYAVPGATEAQSNAALFSNRMHTSETVLRDSKVVEAAQSLWQRGIRDASQLYNLNSKEYQKYDQAKRDFINATLRRESGAVISPVEFENADKQYFVMPGDNPETIQQKKINRLNAIKGIAGAAGPQYKPPYMFDDYGEFQTKPGQWQPIGGNRVRERTR